MYCICKDTNVNDRHYKYLLSEKEQLESQMTVLSMPSSPKNLQRILLGVTGGLELMCTESLKESDTIATNGEVISFSSGLPSRAKREREREGEREGGRERDREGEREGEGGERERERGEREIKKEEVIDHFYSYTQIH